MSNGKITENGFYENGGGGSPSPPPPPFTEVKSGDSEINRDSSIPVGQNSMAPHCSLSDVKLENLEANISLQEAGSKASPGEISNARVENEPTLAAVLVKKDTIVSLGGSGESKLTVTAEVKPGTERIRGEFL